MNGLERRLRQLERVAPSGTSGLPWGKSAAAWTNAQLALAIPLGKGENARDVIGDHVICGRPGALVLGVEEIPLAEEWVRRFGHAGAFN